MCIRKRERMAKRDGLQGTGREKGIERLRLNEREKEKLKTRDR